MPRWVGFDPTEHENYQLYELVSEEVTEGVFETRFEKVEIPFDVAVKTFWYYVVVEEEGAK